MERCYKCKSTELSEAPARDVFAFSNGSATVHYKAMKCDTCGATTVPSTTVKAVELAAARGAAEHARPAGDVFKFLRKSLGMKAEDLASLLDVTPTTISNWEVGKSPVDRSAFVLLTQVVLEVQSGKLTLFNRLLKLAKGRKSPKAAKLAGGDPAEASGAEVISIAAVKRRRAEVEWSEAERRRRA